MDQNNSLAKNKFLNPAKLLRQLNIEHGMKTADFGAGSGYISFQLASIVGSKGLVYAVDIQKPTIQHLANEANARGLTNIKAIWADLELVGRNPIQANSLDVVLIVNMLFQSKKHLPILEEAVRVLKPTGRLIIIDWKKQKTPFGPPEDQRVNLEKTKKIAYDLELNKVQEFEAGPYHFALVFRK